MTINEAMEGYYWAFYKDHGWILINIEISESGFKFAYETPAKDNVHNYQEIEQIYWHNYQHLKKIKEPEFGE